MRRPVFALAFVVVLALAGLGGWCWSYLVTGSPGTGDVVVDIPRGTGVRQIGAILARDQLLADDVRFLGLVAVSGLASKLRAGEYRIPRGLTPIQVLQLLARGETARHSVTLPEGLTMAEIADILARERWIDRQRFLQLAADPAFAGQLGIHAAHLEGYLFPDTYTLIRHEIDEEGLLRMMAARFLQVWGSLPSPERPGWTRHQLVTLASIVEKETADAAERPLIARVFYNRLARGMRLQSDPTVIYGIAGFQGNITKADLKRSTPYNTYVISGLPPAPICSPGQAALQAVLRPAASNALYFVSKNDGTHVFSNSLEDHNRAVRMYQQQQRP
jgi:UPF0755 protein